MELRHELSQILPLLDLCLETKIINPGQLEAINRQRLRQSLARIQNEGFTMKLTQQVLDRGIGDDLTMIDDRDVAAQAFRPPPGNALSE